MKCEPRIVTLADEIEETRRILGVKEVQVIIRTAGKYGIINIVGVSKI